MCSMQSDTNSNYVDLDSVVDNSDEESIINRVYQYIQSIEDARIALLREKEVIMWLFEYHSFLPSIEKKNKTIDQDKYKEVEDIWGREILKKRRPDLKLDKQWTNKFGEHICEELFMLQGKQVWKPMKQHNSVGVNFQPDVETDDAIIEAKIGTYYTSGTAGEKILGVPVKYADIPDLYNKPLYIVCMGGAEKVCRNQYGILPGPKCTPQKQKFLDFFKENKIEYIGATDMLIALVQ